MFKKDDYYSPANRNASSTGNYRSNMQIVEYTEDYYISPKYDFDDFHRFDLSNDDSFESLILD